MLQEIALWNCQSVNIGIVIALENNISVAIIKNADTLNPTIVTKEIMRIRKELHKRKTINATYSWEVRSKEWENFFEMLKK